MATATIQSGAATGKDTYVVSVYAAWQDFNYGITTRNRVGDGASINYTTLIAPDLSTISPAATIQSVRFQMYEFERDAYTTPFTASMYKALVPWAEGTKNGAAAATGEPCGRYREYNATAWAAAGCRGSGTDRAATASASATVANAANGWVEWSGAGLVADVQAWLGGETNHGYAIFGASTGGAYPYAGFYSSDGLYPTLSPKWIIEYTLPVAGEGFVGVSGLGAISSKTPIAGSGAVALSSLGAISMKAPLAGVATLGISGSGGISMKTPLAGSGALTLGGLGVVSAKTPIAGSGLTVNVTAPQVVIIAKTPIAGSGALTLSGLGSISMKTPIAGSAYLYIVGVGAISMSSPLSGSGAILLSGEGVIRVGVPYKLVWTTPEADANTRWQGSPLSPPAWTDEAGNPVIWRGSVVPRTAFGAGFSSSAFSRLVQILRSTDKPVIEWRSR